MPALASVMISSVVSGSISLTAPMKVVLPTPNPPATRNLTAAGSGWSETSLQAIEQALQEDPVSGIGSRRRRGGPGRAAVDEVGHQDLGDRRGQAEPGGDLGHRGRPQAQPE